MIRRAQFSDGEGIYRVERLSFDDPWSLDAFRRELGENDVAFYLVAEINGVVEGYAGLWMIGDEGHITNVAVAPEHRGRGIGSALVCTLVERTVAAGLQSHTLEVRASNEEALNLYGKLGFVSVGRRPGYYQEPKEDAIIMWRREEEE